MTQNPALIEVYLRDAWPSPERVRALHGFWLQWHAELAEETAVVEAEWACGVRSHNNYEGPEIEAAQRVRNRWIENGAPPLFDAQLRAFFERISRTVFTSPNPPATMCSLWEEKVHVGRPEGPSEDNAARNAQIVIAVRKYVRDTSLTVSFSHSLAAAVAADSRDIWAAL